MEAAALWPSPTGPGGAGSFGVASRGGVVGPEERPEGGAEAGEGLPASAATRPPPGKVDEGTSVPVRGGGGSGEARRGGTESGFAESALTASRRTTCLVVGGSRLLYLLP